MRRTRLSLVAAVALAASAVMVARPRGGRRRPEAEARRPRAADRHERLPRADLADDRALTASSDRARVRDAVRETSRQADDGVDLVGGSANVADTVERLQASFAATSGDEVAAPASSVPAT